MSWQKPTDDQQKVSPYDKARTEDGSRVDATLFPDEGQPMVDVPMQTVGDTGVWLGEIDHSDEAVKKRLPGELLSEVRGGARLLASLTSGKTQHIIQQGQQLFVSAVRVKKPDGTYEIRKVTPVAIGVLAALSVGAIIVARRHHK